MKFQEVILKKKISSVKYLFTMCAVVGWILLSKTGYAVPSQPDVCRDVTKVQRYIIEKMPEALWHDEHFIKAIIYEQRKEYKEELGELQIALQAAPDSDYADLLEMTIGDTYAAMKEYENAIAIYKKIIEKYSTSLFLDAVYYNIATAFYKSGNSSEAKEMLDDLINQYPNSVFTPCAKQNIQDIKKKTPPVFLADVFQDDVALLQNETDDYEELVDAFKKIIDFLEKEIVPAKQALDELNNSFYPSDITEQDLQQLLQNIKTLSSYRTINIFRKAAEKSATAFNLAEEFLKKYPDSSQVPSVYNIMVNTHYSLLNIQAAAETYRRMKAAVPKDNSYLISLKPLAEEMRPVLELLFEDADDFYNAAQLQLKDSNTIFAEHFLAKFPQDNRAPQMQVMIGEAYFSMKQYNQARAVYENIVEQHPDVNEYKEARYKIGECYARINEWRLATQHLKDFLAAYPKNLHAKEAQTELHTIGARLAGAGVHDCGAFKKKGNKLADQGQYIAAMEQEQLALACYEQQNNLEGVARVQNNIATLHRLSNNYKEAHGYLSQAQQLLAEQLDNRELEAITLSNLGQLYYDQGRYQDALHQLQAVMPVWETLGKKENLATTYWLLGVSYNKLNDYKQTVRYCHKAYELLSNVKQRAFMVYLQGISYQEIGDYERAETNLKHALALYKQTDDDFHACMVVRNLTMIEVDHKNYKQALLYSEEKTQYCLKAKEYELACQSLQFEATNILMNIGEYQRALTTYQRALDLSEEKNLTKQQAATLVLIGEFYSSHFSKPERGLTYYHQAVNLFVALGNIEEAAEALKRIATTYSTLNREIESLKYYKQAMLLWQKAGNSLKAAAALADIGRIYRYLGDIDFAEKVFKQALNVHELKDTYLEIDTELQLAMLYAEQGKALEARKALGRVLPLDETIPNIKHYKSVLLGRVAIVFMRLGNYQKAVEYYTQRLKAEKKARDVSGQAYAWSNLGNAYENLGDLKKAKDAYLSAIDLWEEIRSSAQVDDIRTMVADQAAATYQPAIAVLMQLQESNQAFDMAERARARSLLDQTGSFKASAPTLMEEEQKIRGKIHHIEAKLQNIEKIVIIKKRRLNNIDKEYEQTIHEEISTPALGKKEELLLAERKRLNAELATEYSTSNLRTQLKNTYVKYLSVLTRIKLAKSTKPRQNKQNSLSASEDVASLNDVQQILAPDTTLLEYYTTSEKIFAFVLTHDTFHAVSIPVKESDIKDKISKLPEARQHGGQVYFQQLYQLLFKPVHQYISTTKVYIVPHGILHYLPFSAFHDGKQYLVEQYTMANLPSASILAHIHKTMMNRESGRNTMLALCKSDAEGIEYATACPQAQKVADLFDAKIFQEDAATETVFKQQAASVDYIHIAAHGEFKSDTPLLSRMYLSADDKNDGFLEASEIFNLQLARNVQLVTLSGCETNITGRKESEKIDSDAVSAGDEIVSLNRAFISAGAPSILSTLWQIPDASTEKLMLKFYRYLKRGYSKGAALRCAQEGMLHEERMSPAKWAGFVLTGDIGPGKGGVSCLDATAEMH